jgi:hypothetical protein
MITIPRKRLIVGTGDDSSGNHDHVNQTLRRICGLRVVRCEERLARCGGGAQQRPGAGLAWMSAVITDRRWRQGSIGRASRERPATASRHASQLFSSLAYPYARRIAETAPRHNLAVTRSGRAKCEAPGSMVRLTGCEQLARNSDPPGRWWKHQAVRIDVRVTVHRLTRGHHDLAPKPGAHGLPACASRHEVDTQRSQRAAVGGGNLQPRKSMSA